MELDDNCQCNIKVDSFTAALNDVYNNATNKSVFIELKRSVDWFITNASPCCKSAGYTMLAAGNLNNEQVCKEYIRSSEKLIRVYPFDYSYLENRRLLYYLFSFKLMHDSAIFYCMEGLKYAERKGVDNMTVTFTLFLSDEFSKQKLHDKAALYAKKCFQMAEKSNSHQNSVYLAASYALYGSSILSIYNTNQKQELLDSALTYATKCQKVAVANSLPQYEWAALKLFGDVSYILKDFKKTLYYTKAILNDPRVVMDEDIQTEAHQLESKVHFELKEYRKVVQSMEEVKKLIGDGKPLYEFVTLGLLHKSLAQLGDYEYAYQNLLRLTLINDSLVNSRNSRIINELELKYEKTKNEQKIRDLEFIDSINSLRIKILALFLIGLVLLALAIYLLSRQRLFRNRQELLKVGQRLNRARMDPHFFFNALASIQTMSMDENQRENTTLYLSKFAKVMRQSLESTYEDMVTLEEETNFLKSYLEVQQLRYPKKFSFKIIVSNGIDATTLLVPGMIIQPFIENSIEHGFKKIDYMGEILVNIYVDLKNLRIEIIDNGNGVKKEHTHKSYPGRAMQIVKDRLFLLDMERKTSSSYKLITGEVGVRVDIWVPLIEKYESINS